MTRRWLWHCGWEADEIDRDAASPFSQWAAAAQDIWDLNAAGTIRKTNPRGANAGKIHYRPTTAGFGGAPSFSGQAVTRTDGWVFWHVPILHSGFLTPSNHKAGDNYVYAHCTNPMVAGEHVAVGCRIAPVPPNTLSDIQIVCHHYSAGALTTAGVIVHATVFTPSANWITVVVAYEVATKNTYLYVNGTLGAPAPWVPAPALVSQSPVCFTADHTSPGVKPYGTDGGWLVDFDDWGGAEGSSIGDRPGHSPEHNVVLSQPDSDITVNWAVAPPPGVAQHFRNWDDENQGPTCPTGCTYNVPTAFPGQRETCTYADMTAGVVEGARVVYDQATGAGHQIIGRTSGAGWINAPAAGEGIGAQGGVVNTCDGDARVQTWHGAQWRQTPEAVPRDWTRVLFNASDFGLDSAIANNVVGECYTMAMGTNLVAPNPNLCPARRRWMGEYV